MKRKSVYICQECGYQSSKWSGQCSDCNAWNTIVETFVTSKPISKQSGYTGLESQYVEKLSDVIFDDTERISTGNSEFNRVLGGGVVPGSAVLIGGDPGVGKSTILLQILAQLANIHSVLYVTGEESLQQVAMRAKRLAIPTQKIKALAETIVEKIIDIALAKKPKVLVIDSIQTCTSENLNSAAGTVSQLREATSQLVKFAKQNQATLFIVGHVTKEGAIAGPRVLEHIVDTVLYFEGQTDSKYRMIRAVKNRFGSVNELGIFAMTEKGLKEVSNPSAIFLARTIENLSGSTVLASWEGSRPMLVEVQALVDQSSLGNPRRVCVGLDNNRVTVCLAVLHRHCGIHIHGHDIFVNVIGGVKILETAADLAIIFTILSSFKGKKLPGDFLAFGEVGLSGEIRPVTGGLERLKEAYKHGFKKALVPYGNTKQAAFGNMEIKGIKTLNEAISYFEEISY